MMSPEFRDGTEDVTFPPAVYARHTSSLTHPDSDSIAVELQG
jgi:hypothetical protein